MLSKSLAVAALVATTQAQSDFEKNWFPTMTQAEYTQKMNTYAPIGIAISDFISAQYEGYEFKSLKSLQSTKNCTACLAATKAGQKALQEYKVQKFAVSLFDDICQLGNHWISYDYCSHFVLKLIPPVLDQVAAFYFQPEFMCERSLDICTENNYEMQKVQDYVDRVLSTKPDIIQNDDYQDQLYAQIYQDIQSGTERETLNIVQFTDVHIDLDYAEGYSIDCGDVLCCRAESGQPKDADDSAGPYGSMGWCDIPPSVLYKMGEKINELAPQVLFWTGDVPPHDQWNYNQEAENKYQNFLYDFMTTNLTSWSTYPLEGNHEFAVVINSQDLDSDQPDPTISLLSDLWSIYLDEDSIAQFLENGSYAQQLVLSDGTEMSNVKVIAVNSEAAYNANVYNISNRNDPGGILAWLEATLLQMEQDGQIAIMIGHAPPNNGSQLSGWTKRYQALMERFQHIVRLSFFGHVHQERMYTDHSISSGKPIHFNVASGALTTFRQAYPSFRRFVLDKETLLPLQIETYTLDVNAENPDFVLDHELTEWYNVTDLSPSSMSALSSQMRNDSDLAMKYFNTKYQNGIDLLTKCNSKCMLEAYCETISSTHDDERECRGQGEHPWIHDGLNQFAEWLMQPWYKHYRIPRSQIEQFDN